MSSGSQKKILGIIVQQIADHGLEAVRRPQWANTGCVAIEKPGAVGSLAEVTYAFNDNYYTLSIYRAVGAQLVGVPSQPPRQGYFDHLINYPDAAGFAVFQKHLTETLERILPKPKAAAPSKAPAPAAQEALADQHGGNWGEHPDHPVQDWKYQVENDDTRLGYWEWVAHELEIQAELEKQAGARG